MAAYRLTITRIAPALPAQASSSYRLLAPGDALPVAFAACLFGDGDGRRAEREGRAAAARHARGPAEVEVTSTTVGGGQPDPGAAAAIASALAELAALTAEVDALAARVRAAYPDQVACRRGCDACCRQPVGVSRIEAARLAAAAAARPAAARAALAATVAGATAARAAGDDGAPCGALAADGACQLYADRPLVCRSHGLVHALPPAAAPRPASGRSLPVLERSCTLNFGGALPAVEHAYDAEAWSQRLLAADAALAAALDLAAAPAIGRGLALADVLAALVPT